MALLRGLASALAVLPKAHGPGNTNPFPQCGETKAGPKRASQALSCWPPGFQLARQAGPVCQKLITHTPVLVEGGQDPLPPSQAL